MPTSTRKKWPFYGGLPANPCWFSILRRRGGRPCPPAGKCPFSRKTDANPQHFQWADVGIGPYDRQRKISQFCGRTESSAPTKGVENHAGHAKNRRVSRLYHRFSYVKYWPPPRCFRRKKSSGFANAGRIREIYILRCRGRCLHRPARNGRFMAAFRRNRVDFLFYAVGADDPVRPPENALFHGKPMRNRNIFNGPM